MPIATKMIQLDRVESVSAAIREGAELLRAGEVVAFPTETVYGLGANALDPIAVSKIYEAKGRPSNNPLIVHVARIDQAKSLTTVWPDLAERLVQAFWPGPLTLVLPKSELVPTIVTGGGNTVAIRMPDHPVAEALLLECALPLAAPSANRSTELSPTTGAHVFKSLNGRIPLILDSGPVRVGIESTVLDLTSPVPRILRPGIITPHQIEQIVGKVELMQKLIPTDGRDIIYSSPGLMKKHYAPRTPLELHENIDWHALDQRRLVQKLSVVAFEHDKPTGDDLGFVQMPFESGQYAAELFRVLHNLDEQGLDAIVVKLPPDDLEWLAVQDRLRRAAEKE